ncbi:MAG: hypothetical protein FD146_1982 [Anaerolineaceae bacterium]|nr:MAG: hypothetical protein FD146_1982 [Anaerolineaceae bacterium]
MNSCTKNILLAVAALLAAALACTINVGGPGYPTPAIPISTEAVAGLQSNIQTAVAAGTETGQVTLVFTEPELTSYLYYYFEAQSSPLLTNPQVYLREGQMRIYGTAVQGNLEAFVYIVLTAGVDDQGQIQIEVTSADFGPMPVPVELKDAFTAIIQEAYTGALGPAATGFRLETVVIADGTMTLTGRTR